MDLKEFDTAEPSPPGHQPEIVVDGAPVPPHLSATFGGRLANWLVERRWPLLLLGLILTAIAYFPAQRLAYDRSVENMFAPDDPILAPYHKLQRTFGGNEVALAAYDDADLLTPGGLERLEKLSAALEHVEGIASVLSLTRSPLGQQLLMWPIASQRRSVSQAIRRLHREHRSTHGGRGVRLQA